MYRGTSYSSIFPLTDVCVGVPVQAEQMYKKQEGENVNVTAVFMLQF